MYYILALLSVIFLLVVIQRNFTTDTSSLTFSNTQTMGEIFEKKANSVNKHHLDIIDNLNLESVSFPANDSRDTLEELTYLRGLQDTRHLYPNISDNLNSQVQRDYCIDAYPISKKEKKALSRCINKCVDPIFYYIKRHFNRVRPKFLDHRIQPGVSTPTHPAFPSGHATWNYFIAKVISDKYPEKTNEVYGIADEFATNRELGGVHYPSDTEYGYQLAHQIYNEINDPLHPFHQFVKI